MADVQKMARDSAMVNGNTPYVRTQGSRYDEGLRKQYFADPTRLYANQIGDVASNVYDAKCQGIGSGDWYDWTPTQIRVSPAAIASTGETMPDDWQKLHVLKPLGIDTVPIGAYLTFAGNTWIVYKGRNMGSVLGDGIIRRCNAVINTLDYYGNVVSVPMSYAKIGTLGNASHATENSIVAKNYISCVCQLNEVSKNFAENTRLVLGNMAYAMRGVNNFTREFTDDPDSVHLMTFTIERSELLPQDSVEKQCADYGDFSWEISVSGLKTMAVNTSQQLIVKSTRNGETVVDSEEHPIEYVFSMSFGSPFVVDGNGEVTSVFGRTGTGKVTVKLKQNPDIQQTFTIRCTNSASGIEFGSVVPDSLSEYESAEITAYSYSVVNGAMQKGHNFLWGFSGPNPSAYAVETVDAYTKRITAYCASGIPLTITLYTPNGQSVTSAEIVLTGK